MEEIILNKTLRSILPKKQHLKSQKVKERERKRERREKILFELFLKNPECSYLWDYSIPLCFSVTRANTYFKYCNWKTK